MSLIDKASGKSFWRGIDYFERKQVTSCKKVSKEELQSRLANYILEDEESNRHNNV